MSGPYGVAPLFSIRLAGTPFDTLDRLATPVSASLARKLVTGEQESHADDTGWSCAHLLEELNQVLDQELNAARASLLSASRRFLPPYLVFGTGGVTELQKRLLRDNIVDAEPLPRRNAKAGDRERHLLMYLQRVCAKNDTLSEWGPTVWGTVGEGLRFAGQPGIASRMAYLERWTAHAAAAAMNADPAVRDELAPRLHPDGRLEEKRFVFAHTGEVLSLDGRTCDLLRRCTGGAAAHSLGAPPGVLGHLATCEVLRWEVEVPAMQPEALTFLLEDVKNWRESPTRERWLQVLLPIVTLTSRFAAAAVVEERVRIMAEARALMTAIAPARATVQRVLYSACLLYTSPSPRD